MAIIANLPYNFTNGTTADASQVMQNFNQIVNNVNTNAAQLTLTPQIASENIFTQPQQMSDPTKPAHAVTLGYATNNIGFLGTANTWTKNNVFSGGIDNTPIGATTPSTGKFTTGVFTNTLNITSGSYTTPTAGSLFAYGHASAGAVIGGSGSSADISFMNKNGTVVATIPTGTGNFQVGSGADTGDKFQVFGSSYLAGLVKIYGANYPQLQFQSGNTTSSQIICAGTTSYFDIASGGILAFRNNINGSNVASIDTNGKGSFNGGIALNGGTAALNAYEEGTFTPTLAGSTTAGSNTYTNQNGTYTRIGRLVIAKFFLTLSAKDAAMAGSVEVKGLPYTSNATANTYCEIGAANASYVTLPSGASYFYWSLAPNTNYATLACCGSNIAGAAVASSAIASNTTLSGTIVYNI